VSQIKYLLIFIVLLIFSGCAAQSQNMFVSDCKILSKYPHSVSVKVYGGRETNPLWTSQISNSALCSAIKKSILENEVFSSVSLKNPDYSLEVAIEKITQPVIGLDIKMKMTAKWTLIKNDNIIWSDSITSTYTAKLGEAFIAAERIQKANEGVARNNIKNGLYKLSSLPL